MEDESDDAILALLEALDEAEPVDFDYQAAVTRFDAFVRDFEREIGKPERVETRSYIQDASFHSQLLPQLEGNEPHWLRFSRFGQMVSMHDDAAVPQELMRRIVALVGRHGYRFVPYRLLARPYPDAESYSGFIPDWYRRYFDWI